MQKQEKQKYYFIKSGKYIVTIQDLSGSNSNLFCNWGFKKCTENHNFKIISIEDICGIFYDEINNFFGYKIKKNQIFNTIGPYLWYCKNKNDAYYTGFIEIQQWRLFPNGYSDFCSFNYTEDIKIECFINNGKLIGSFKWFEWWFNCYILKHEFNFDYVDSTDIVTHIKYKNDGAIDEIGNYSKQQFIDISKTKFRGLFNLVVKLEYFS